MANLENTLDGQDLIHDPNAPLEVAPGTQVEQDRAGGPRTPAGDLLIPPPPVDDTLGVGGTFVAQDIMAMLKDALKEHSDSMRKTHEQEVSELRRDMQNLTIHPTQTQGYGTPQGSNPAPKNVTTGSTTHCRELRF